MDSSLTVIKELTVATIVSILLSWVDIVDAHAVLTPLELEALEIGLIVRS